MSSSSKSPEALHIFFSGPGALRALKSHDFTPREIRLIEAAINSAQSNRPDIDLLQRADAVIQSAQTIRNSSVMPENRPAKNNLSSLSGHFTPPESREKKIPFYRGRGRGLIGYLNWRWNWKHIYLPLITLGIILLLLILVKLFPGIGEGIRSSGVMHMNVDTYRNARQICLDLGKKLAKNPREILPRLNKMIDAEREIGYWLRDGRVFIPKTGEIRPGDALRHWFICVDE